MALKNLLFNPGPTNVSDEVRSALLTPDMCHRHVEFKETMDRVNKNIVKILKGEESYSSVLFVSSGTGANDAMINPIEGKILAINHGRYSMRLCHIAKRYHIPMLEFFIPDLEPLDLDTLEDTIQKNSDITHIMMVHHETTTGMLNPIKEIGALCKKYGKILLVDSISSIGSHYFNLQEFNIGFCTLTPNKCLEGLPGVSFVIGKNSEFKKLKSKARSFYLDLYYQWECQQRKKIPYTGAVQTIFALDKALKRLMNEGYENRIGRYNQLAAKMRRGLEKLGFELIEYPPKYQANFLTLMNIPKLFDYCFIRDILKKSNITIYTDQASLDKNRLFIATMGNITGEEIDFFLAELKKAMSLLSKRNSKNSNEKVCHVCK